MKITTVPVVFCYKCGSSKVDIQGWQAPGMARIECSCCGHAEMLRGFTLGRIDATEEQILKAARDAACYNREPCKKQLIMQQAVEELADMQEVLRYRAGVV